MQIEPSAGVFAASYAQGAAQVVWTTLVADLDTPVSAFLKTGAGKKLSFLLESVEGGAVRGRYSIIGIAPDVVWRAFGERAEINRRPLSSCFAVWKQARSTRCSSASPVPARLSRWPS